MDGKIEMAIRHSIIMEDRNTLQITGVTDVESFDEQIVVLVTSTGELVIKGQGLHITKIDVMTGNISMEGMIDQLAYSDIKPSHSFFGKLFR